jgi:hypothetical protein
MPRTMVEQLFCTHLLFFFFDGSTPIFFFSLIPTFDIFLEMHPFDSRITKRVLLGYLFVLYSCYPCCQIIGTFTRTHAHTQIVVATE